MSLLPRGLKTRKIKAKDLQDGMKVVYNERSHLAIRYVLRQDDMVSTLGTLHDLYTEEDDFRDFPNDRILDVIDPTPTPRNP